MNKNFKIGDIVRVTDWGEAYPTDDSWFEERVGTIPLNYIMRYAYGNHSNYDKYKNSDDPAKYTVLYVSDGNPSRVLICNEDSIDREVYMLDVNGIELYDELVEMTISQIEKKLGISHLRIISEEKDSFF